jgi:two-component system, OmpR family, KDP operon response regulator KdpE
MEPPPNTSSPILEAAGIRLDVEHHTVSAFGQPVDLTPIEFNLLYQLMSEAGKVLSHRDLLQRVWGPEYGDEVEYVRVYIGRLRHKLAIDRRLSDVIITEHGLGYRLTAI